MKSDSSWLRMGICPWLIRWALVMMRLLAAWRKISVRRMTGSRPLSMQSRSTSPQPTGGSWSASPTIKSRVPRGRAFNRAFIRGTSTMLISSTMIRS